MTELLKKLELIKKACDDKLADDISKIKIDRNGFIADYFIVVTGNSSNQTQAIADEIIKEMHENGFELINKDGYKEGNWILLDYNDIIVHIFLPEDRNYYNLEKLWESKGVQ